MTAPYYRDDKVTLYPGDALAVLRELPTGSIDALITDPPYSSGGMVRGDRMGTAVGKYTGREGDPDAVDFTGDNRDQRAYAYWCSLWLSECLRITRSGGIAVAFTDWRQLPTTTDSIQAGGWVWRGIVPWAKPIGTFRLQAGRYGAQCEYAVWGSNGDLPLTSGKGSAFPGFYQAATPKDREHITQKPLDVMRDLMQIVPEGGVVLDPFMGSGTTGVAAMLERRRFVGVELSAHYAEVSERRIRVAQGQAIPRGAQDCLDLSDTA